MAAATIFDMEHVSTVHPDNLDGRVIPLVGVVEGGESISGVICWILGQCQGQTGGVVGRHQKQDTTTCPLTTSSNPFST